jgi:DNA-binding NtrC family response regulator
MRGKVLIVDDYSDWRNMLSGLIEREGHLVVSVSTENKDLDLVILDIRLVETEENNEDGMRLLAEIRKRLSFTRVIMVTGVEQTIRDRKTWKDKEFIRDQKYEMWQRDKTDPVR